MIAAYDMEQVSESAAPHSSHKMGEKESTLIACASNDRFGTVRACERCEGREVWAGGAGSHYFDPELKRPCQG